MVSSSARWHIHRALLAYSDIGFFASRIAASTSTPYNSESASIMRSIFPSFPPTRIPSPPSLRRTCRAKRFFSFVPCRLKHGEFPKFPSDQIKWSRHVSASDSLTKTLHVLPSVLLQCRGRFPSQAQASVPPLLPTCRDTHYQRLACQAAAL